MATATALESRILDLWFHRSDVFSIQFYHEKGSGYSKVCSEHPSWVLGRCKHKAKYPKCGQCPEFRPLSISEKIINMHLQGQGVTLGAYQIGADGTTVKWLCADLDDHGLCSEQELQDTALLAQLSLRSLHMPSYLEASGGSGWRCHLWVFFAAPIPAIKARVILDAALREAGLDDKPFIERFPKQSRALGGYGNLVKVPFGVHRKTKKRSQFLDDELRPIADVRHALDRITTVDPTVVDMVIDLKGLTLEEQRDISARPATNFSHPAEIMDRTLTHCWYFREFLRQQASTESTVDYEDWWNFVLYCSRFGDAGVQRVLDESAKDGRYDFEYTVNIVNYIRQHGYHAPSCKRLHNGPGAIHCQLDPLHCGAPNAGVITGTSDYEQRDQLRPQRLVVQL